MRDYTRPWPPANLYAPDELADLAVNRFRQAPEVWQWIETHILAETGSIHNPDHAHLLDADIGLLGLGAVVFVYTRYLSRQAGVDSDGK